MLTKFKHLLTPPAFSDPERNRIAGILYTVLLVALVIMTLATTISASVSYFNQQDLVVSWTAFAGIFVLIGLLWLTRRGYLQVAGMGLVVGVLFIITGTILDLGGLQNVTASAYVVAIIIAGMIVGAWGALATGFISTAILLAVNYGQSSGLLILPPGTSTPTVVYPAIFIISGLLMYQAARNYQTSLQQAQQSNQELTLLSNTLEDRIVERTRELSLAADVGRQVSRIRSLDQLLPEAVELIRSRFDIYYAQIYLTDEQSKSLVLRAGTGSVGQQLVQTGHRLPLLTNSVNGTAVVEKQAVLIEDTKKSTLYRFNPLLPETRAELAVPLIFGEDVVGVLNLQSKQVGVLTPESLPAFQTLSGQLAIAIANALLIDELTEARAQVEAQSQRLTREGWREFLDGIRHSQLIGYRYNGHTQQVETVSHVDERSDDQALAAPIVVGGQTLGQVQLRLGDAAEQDNIANQSLVEAVARQVAQQVENLRLLAETARYRAEAEDVLRRLTHESWTSEVGVVPDMVYAYDRRQIKRQPVADLDENGRLPLIQPLRVRGETIGLLEMDIPEGQDATTTDLITAVADQLSNHLENLRLSQTSEIARSQAEQRSQEMTQINQIVTSVAGSLNLEQGLQIIADGLADILNVDQVAIALLDDDQETLRIVADHYNPQTGQSAIGIAIPLAGNELSQQVLQEQHSIYIEDAQNHPRTAVIHDMLKFRGIESLYIFPIVAGNKSIGTVGIDILEKGRTLTPEQQNLAETIIFQAATAIQNSQLFTQLQGLLENTERQSLRLAILNDLGDLFSRSQSEEEVYQLVKKNARRLFYYDRLSILRYDETAENATILAAEDKIYQELETGMLVPLNHEISSEVIKQRQVLYFDNDEQQPDSKAVSSLVAPLLTGRGVSGTINVSSLTPNAYSDQDKNNLLQLANYVSASLENLRLFATVEARAEELAVLNEVARSVSYQLEPSQLLEAIFTQVRRVLPSDIFFVGLFDQTQETVTYPYIYEDGQLSTEAAKPINPASNIYQVVTKGKPVIKSLTSEERDYIVTQQPDLLLGDNTEVRVPASLLYVPLQSGQRIIGAMSIQAYAYDVYDESNLTLLSGIASHAAVALENARLYAAVQRRAQREQLVNEITQRIQTTQTVESALQTAVQELGQALHAQYTQVEILPDRQPATKGVNGRNA